MRRRIGLLVAATTSAIVLAFVIPLCLLVRNMAADRAMADADQEARNIAILVSSLNGDPTLGDVVAAVDQRSPATTTVVPTSTVTAPPIRTTATATTTGTGAPPPIRRK